MTDEANKTPVIVGLAGGVGSGKSTVAEALGELGATVLNADRMAHEVLDQPHTVAAVRKRFGDQVIGADGRIDRRALGAEVFGDPEDIRALENIVHPPVKARLMKELHHARTEGSAPMVVIDAPLVFEAGLNAWCDVVVFVDAPEPVRFQRAARRHGWTHEEFARREAAQWPTDKKRRMADHIVVNNGSIPEVLQASEELFKQLVEREQSSAAGNS